MKTKSIIIQALETMNLTKGSEDYSRAYRALHQRKAKILLRNGRVNLKSLTEKPLRQLGSRQAIRSKTFEISSLSDLFSQEAKLATDLEKVRKEIVNAFGKGIREARKRKINIGELIEGCGDAISNFDEKRNSK